MKQELATITTTLHVIQSALKVPKDKYNSFGKYNYRTCESIVEAAKPILYEHGFSLLMNDEIIMIGNRFYVKATAKISNGVESYECSAFAREEESKKGMDGAQVTGAASSYARKYALNGLFAIDDTEDADATDKKPEKQQDLPANFYPAWQTAINACDTVEKLQELWEGNKATCIADPQIKKMFVDKKTASGWK